MTVHYLEMVDIRKHVAKDLTTLQKALEPAQTYLLSKAGKDVHIQVPYIQLITEIQDALLHFGK